MEIMLADNIRRMRKERSLTQEQLAEVLGVTTGAVYKWEAGLSNPELNLIVKMADFFDTSVDVLLGYEVKDNRLVATIQRLKDFSTEKNPVGIDEAEKALKKYPHTFELVHESASLFRSFAIESGDKKLSQRALELYEQSLLLISQNKDPDISEATIYGELADIMLDLGKTEKAIDVLKKHNAGGRYNDKIGLTLSTDSKRTDEAVNFLSEALLGMITSFTLIASGYMNVYYRKKDYASLKELLLWADQFLTNLKKGEQPSFLDKLDVGLLGALAGAYIKLGEDDAARRCLENALEIARRFDNAPSYDPNDIPFVNLDKKSSVYDSLGTTAVAALESVVESLAESEKVKKISTIWKEVKKNE